MGSRSLGELLLRPTSLSHIPFAQNFRRAAPSWSTYRMISNSPATHSAQPQPKEDRTFEYYEPPTSQTQSQPTQNQAPATAEQTSEAIDSIFWGNSPPPNFTRQSPYAPAANQQERARNVFGSGFSNSAPGERYKRRALDIASMSMDGLPLDLPNQTTTPVEPEPQNYPRLNPAYGRTVELNLEKGRDLVRGINMLGSLMSRNKVRADFMKQRYHERNGLKRKRLKSERWRARFKTGFQEVTARVSELTRKGW